MCDILRQLRCLKPHVRQLNPSPGMPRWLFLAYAKGRRDEPHGSPFQGLVPSKASIFEEFNGVLADKNFTKFSVSWAKRNRVRGGRHWNRARCNRELHRLKN